MRIPFLLLVSSLSVPSLAQISSIIGQYTGVSDLDERCLVTIQNPDQLKIEVVAGSKRLDGVFPADEVVGQLARGEESLKLETIVGTSHGLEKTTANIVLGVNQRVSSIRMTWIETVPADFGGQESIVCDLLN
jgi:hypothetical protein